MYDIIGFSIAGLGAVLSIIGSWFVSSSFKDERRLGYLIWMIGNPINMVIIIGAIMGVWTCLPLIITLGVQGYYLCTAYRGWKSNV